MDSLSPSNKEPRRVRIVSLLPSITEILSCIGVADHIVGITHECDYPPETLVDAKVVITSDINPRTMTQAEIHQAVCGSLLNGNSLYGIDSSVLRSVKPDFVFTQSLCDVCAVSYPVVLDKCSKIIGGGVNPSSSAAGDDGQQDIQLKTSSKESLLNPQVISMEPNNLQDVLSTFTVASRVLGPAVEKQAKEVVSKLEYGFKTIQKVVQKNNSSRPKVAFMEWHNPIYTGGHWIPDMFEIAGGDYNMCRSGERSSLMKDEDFIQLDPDFILIGPCGFSLDRALEDTLTMFKEKNWWKGLRAVQQEQVFALDGNSYYARPGPRLLQGCGIMAACIHGEKVAKELGQELALSSGYCRVTLDMYDKL